MAWPVLAAAAIGYLGQQEAASSARGTSRENMAQQERWNMLQDPFSAGGNRRQYVSQLNDLMRGGVSGIMEDPNFKARMAAGLQMSQRQASATGMGQSGNMQLALQRQGSQMAGDYFTEQYNRLAQLSGAARGGGSAPTGMSAGDVYQMGMGQTAATAGLIRGAAGLFGRGSGGSSMTSTDYGAEGGKLSYDEMRQYSQAQGVT